MRKPTILCMMLLCIFLCNCLMIFPVESEEIVFSLTLSVDRPSYEPGYLVRISGYVTDDEGSFHANEYVGLQINNPYGFVDAFQPVTDDEGRYQIEYLLYPQVMMGTYTVDVAKGYARAQTTFEVVEQAPNIAPYVPFSPFPSNTSNGLDASVLLSWSGGDPDPEDQVTYTLLFGSSMPLSTLSENQSDTSFYVGGLEYQTIYHWQIISSDANGHHTHSPIWMFTTRSQQNNPPMVPHTLDGPRQGYHGTAYSYTVSTIDYDNDSVFYQFKWGNETYSPWIGPYPSGQMIMINHSWSQPGTYSLLVRAKDINEGQTNWSEPIQVQIENREPYIPRNPTPPNESTARLLSSTLRWMGDDPDRDDITVYDIYFGTSFPLEKIISHQRSSSFSPSLTHDTTYYWQIVSYDLYNVSTIGPIWQFHTISESTNQHVNNNNGGSTTSSDDQDEHDTDPLIVNPQPPLPKITVSPIPAHVNVPLIFDASDSSDDGYITTWIWDFGDGSMGQGELVSHAYSSQGTYTVSLTVFDNQDNSQETMVDLIIIPPIQVIIDFSIENDTISESSILSMISIESPENTNPLDIILRFELMFNDSIIWFENTSYQVKEYREIQKIMDMSSFHPGFYHYSVTVSYLDQEIKKTTTTIHLPEKSQPTSEVSLILILIVCGISMILFIMYIAVRMRN